MSRVSIAAVSIMIGIDLEFYLAAETRGTSPFQSQCRRRGVLDSLAHGLEQRDF